MTQESELATAERTGGPGRLLAWVGIVAGVVFIVAVVFFSGFFVAWAQDGHTWGHGGAGGGRDGTCPMMGSGGMMGPSGGRGPGGMGPGRSMAPQPPPSTAPTTPPR